MDFTSHPLKTTVTTEVSSRPTVTIVENRFAMADLIFESMPDLVNDRMRAWYCGRFHVLGRDRVMKYAAQARADGFDKRRLFSYLLKNGK